jgi:hypothetical protein
MPFRRYRRSFSRRPRARYEWIRSNEGASTLAHQPTANVFDLMAVFNTKQGGWLLQLPDITVWRIHLKISIRFTFNSTAYDSNAGAFVGLFVAPRAQINAQAFSLVTNQYSYKPLIWDMLYTSETIKEGTFSPTINTTDQHVLYKEYDVKSHRRFQNMDDTLWLEITEIGDMSLQSLSFIQSTLYKLPH